MFDHSSSSASLTTIGTYEGEWKANKKHGKGIHRYANGSSYDGDWKADKMHGYGIYTFENKDSFEGEFVQGNMHGKGVYTQCDGEQYQGTWEDDKEHGSFVRTTIKGFTRKEEWEHGERISETEYTAIGKDSKVEDLMTGRVTSTEDVDSGNLQLDKPLSPAKSRTESVDITSDRASLMSFTDVEL